jgi:hypothetical protein
MYEKFHTWMQKIERKLVESKEQMEAPDDSGKEKIYGSVERWYWDGRGDIWLAVITAFLVLI